MTAKDLLKYFAQAYEKKSGIRYVIAHSRDMPIMASLLKRGADPEGVRRAIDWYFASPQKSHGLPFFAACIADLLVMGAVHEVAEIRKNKQMTNPDRERYE